LKNSKAAIWNCPTTEPNGRDEQRSVEQTGEDENVLEGDALVVESAVRKIAQELFVGPSLRI